MDSATARLPETRAADGPRHLPAARRHRSRQTHRRGSPTLSTAAGWEAQEAGSRRNPPGFPGPRQRVLSGTGQGPQCLREPGGSPKSPGEVTSQ